MPQRLPINISDDYWMNVMCYQSFSEIDFVRKRIICNSLCIQYQQQKILNQEKNIMALKFREWTYAHVGKPELRVYIVKELNDRRLNGCS